MCAVAHAVCVVVVWCRSEIPHLDVPLHTVLKLVPKAYGCEVTRYRLAVASCEDAAHGGITTTPPPTPLEQEQAAAVAAAQPGILATTAAVEQSKEVRVDVEPANVQA